MGRWVIEFFFFGYDGWRTVTLTIHRAIIPQTGFFPTLRGTTQPSGRVVSDHLPSTTEKNAAVIQKESQQPTTHEGSSPDRRDENYDTTLAFCYPPENERSFLLSPSFVFLAHFVVCRASSSRRSSTSWSSEIPSPLQQLGRTLWHSIRCSCQTEEELEEKKRLLCVEGLREKSSSFPLLLLPLGLLGFSLTHSLVQWYKSEIYFLSASLSFSSRFSSSFYSSVGRRCYNQCDNLASPTSADTQQQQQRSFVPGVRAWRGTVGRSAMSPSSSGFSAQVDDKRRRGEEGKEASLVSPAPTSACNIAVRAHNHYVCVVYASFFLPPSKLVGLY